MQVVALLLLIKQLASQSTEEDQQKNRLVDEINYQLSFPGSWSSGTRRLH